MQEPTRNSRPRKVVCARYRPGGADVRCCPIHIDPGILWGAVSGIRGNHILCTPERRQARCCTASHLPW